MKSASSQPSELSLVRRLWKCFFRLSWETSRICAPWDWNKPSASALLKLNDLERKSTLALIRFVLRMKTYRFLEITVRAKRSGSFPSKLTQTFFRNSTMFLLSSTLLEKVRGAVVSNRWRSFPVIPSILKKLMFSSRFLLSLERKKDSGDRERISTTSASLLKTFLQSFQRSSRCSQERVMERGKREMMLAIVSWSAPLLFRNRARPCSLVRSFLKTPGWRLRAEGRSTPRMERFSRRDSFSRGGSWLDGLELQGRDVTGSDARPLASRRKCRICLWNITQRICVIREDVTRDIITQISFRLCFWLNKAVIDIMSMFWFKAQKL